MLGFLIGTACLIGLIKVLRAGSCHRGWGYRGYGYGGGACGGGRWGGGPAAFGGHHGHGPWEGGYDRGYHGGPFRTHSRGGYGPRSHGMANFVLRRLFEALDTTPGQEKVIAASFDEMRAEAAKHRGEVQKTREDLAKALRSPSFDETVMGELFARHDTALEALRKAMVGSIAKVHEALEPEQRAKLAEMVERNPGFWGGFGGPGVEM